MSEVHLHMHGAVAHISLARPKALHALTQGMCEAMSAALLAWRDDPSNAEPAYARNRIRHGLAEALAEVHPAAARNVLRTAELLRDEAEVLDGLVSAELEGNGTARGTIALDRLAELHGGDDEVLDRLVEGDSQGDDGEGGQEAGHQRVRLARRASKIINPVATARFRLSARPTCGMRTSASHACAKASVRPACSLPMRRSVGFAP